VGTSLWLAYLTTTSSGNTYKATDGYLHMNGGTVDIANTLSLCNDVNSKGCLFMNGGSISATAISRNNGKAYITFNYRVLHPGVTGRLIFFGILIALPAIIAKQLWLKIALVVVGALLILLGLFRQYISLALTKKNDEAYRNGTEFTYDFTQNDARFYTGDKLTSSISKYKEIISFYYDDDFYYMGIWNRDFFILPKSRFTIGDPAQFEDFIYRKSKKTCKWIPDKFSDRMKLRRAARALNSEQSKK
jgi:hypothetical protein